MKSRPKDLKMTPSLSRALDKKVRKSLMAKERQQGSKECKT